MNSYNLCTAPAFSNKTVWVVGPVLLAASLLVTASAARAQVAVSLGVQEVWDDNIYLEDDREIVLPTLPPGAPPIVLSERSDGDPNDDMITNVTLGLNTPLEVSKWVTGGFDAKVGGFFFADHSDDNRITVDSLLNVDAADILIPQPYYLGVSSALTSNSNDITVAQGSAARQTESHDATLSMGLRGVEVAPKTEAGLGYRFVRHDFLGDWTIGGGSSDDDAVTVDDGTVILDANSDEQGADWFQNGIDGGLAYRATDRLELTLTASGDYYSFTNVEGNGLQVQDTEDLDRFDAGASVGFKYTVSEKMTIGAYVGPEYTRYAEEPEAVEITVVNPDGTVSTVLDQNSQSEDSLAYGAHLDYMLSTDSLFNTSIRQSLGTDIAGQRIEARVVTASLSQNIGERLDFIGSGLLTQYSGGDSLSDATDRWEATASLRYALTQSLSLSLGYNYVSQDGGDPLEDGFASHDYDGNRVFVGIAGGLVGVKS